ncbi:MAG: DUF3489 domain-containing protein [Devosia sp.]
MAKKPTKTRSRTRKTAPKKPEIKTTKQNTVLALLRRQNGASIPEIVDATDWQPHSVRGFFAGALKKRLAIDVVSEKINGERRYYVAPLKPA